MNDLRTYQTLLAWTEGAPLAARQALHIPRVQAQDTLLLAFLRMAGEVLPWGFAIGHPGEAPRIVSIPEPRNVDLVAQLCVQLAEVLLPHVGHPEYAAASSFDPAARQIWLPGSGHIDLLHLLALRFSHARRGDPGRTRTLRALARATGFLFRESSRPGVLSVQDASACLRELFVFPAEPTRCAHLGYLLGWLAPARSREERQAMASEAELPTAGDTLDPALERDHLAPVLSAWREGAPGAEEKIREILHEELERRWRWTEDAWRLVQDDARPVSEGVAELEQLAREEHRSHYLRVEQQILESREETSVFVPHPETDHSSAAAVSRYFDQVHAQEVSESYLLESDAGLRAEALAAGEIIAGTLTQLSEVREGRTTHIHWVVEAPFSPHRGRCAARSDAGPAPGACRSRHPAGAGQGAAGLREDLYLAVRGAARRSSGEARRGGDADQRPGQRLLSATRGDVRRISGDPLRLAGSPGGGSRGAGGADPRQEGAAAGALCRGGDGGQMGLLGAAGALRPAPHRRGLAAHLVRFHRAPRGGRAVLSGGRPRANRPGGDRGRGALADLRASPHLAVPEALLREVSKGKRAAFPVLTLPVSTRLPFDTRQLVQRFYRG